MTTTQIRIAQIKDLPSAGGDLPAGTTTGDFIRYNSATGAWEVAHETIALEELILTPASAPPTDAEGGVYYDAEDKTVYVCTSDS